MLYTNRTKEEEAIKFLKRFPEQEQNVMLATFFKFIFVREPFERLLSAYKDKFVYHDREARTVNTVNFMVGRF